MKSNYYSTFFRFFNAICSFIQLFICLNWLILLLLLRTYSYTSKLDYLVEDNKLVYIFRIHRWRRVRSLFTLGSVFSIVGGQRKHAGSVCMCNTYIYTYIHIYKYSHFVPLLPALLIKIPLLGVFLVLRLGNMHTYVYMWTRWVGRKHRIPKCKSPNAHTYVCIYMHRNPVLKI